MALDVRIVDSGKSALQSRTFRVASGAAGSITPGKPVKINGNYVIVLATGDPEVGTDRMVGISNSTSTDTAAADGTVEVLMVVPGQTVMRSLATTVANIDTDGELLLLLNDSVTYTLTSTTFSVNEDEGDDPDVHGLILLDGNIDDGTLDYVLKTGAGLEGLV